MSYFKFIANVTASAYNKVGTPCAVLMGTVATCNMIQLAVAETAKKVVDVTTATHTIASSATKIAVSAATNAIKSFDDAPLTLISPAVVAKQQQNENIVNAAPSNDEIRSAGAVNFTMPQIIEDYQPSN